MIAALAEFALTSPGVEAQQPLNRLQEIKAAVTLNVVKFVEWPADEGTVRRICAAEDAALGGALEELDGEVVRSKRVDVRVLADVSDNAHCHVLLVSSGALRRAGLAPESVNRPRLLTIGDGDGFARAGGMVAMRVWRNRIRLRINRDAVQAAGLRMSSQLLALADVLEAARPDG